MSDCNNLNAENNENNNNNTNAKYVIKQYYNDFIVKEVYNLDSKDIICDSLHFEGITVLNNTNNDDFNIKLGFPKEPFKIIKSLYIHILNLENELQKHKEKIISNLIGDTDINTLSKTIQISKIRLGNLENDLIKTNLSQIKDNYSQLMELLNSIKPISFYFYLPSKEKRLEIYQQLRSNPLLIYEIIDYKNEDLKVSQLFGEKTNKILKITQCVDLESQFHFTVKKTNKTTVSVVSSFNKYICNIKGEKAIVDLPVEDSVVLSNTSPDNKTAYKIKNKKGLKNISFAGNKDKRGITYQRFSVKTSLKSLLLFNYSFYNKLSITDINKNTRESFSIADINTNTDTKKLIKSINIKELFQLINNKIPTPEITLSQFVSCQKNIQLGDLLRNYFEITVRKVSPDILNRIYNTVNESHLKGNILLIPNKFGPQRFGNKNFNYLIGKCLFDGDIKGAEVLFNESLVNNGYFINEGGLANETNNTEEREQKQEFNENLLINETNNTEEREQESNENNLINKKKKKLSEVQKTFFKHSYQSHIFNIWTSTLLSKEDHSTTGAHLLTKEDHPTSETFTDLLIDSIYLKDTKITKKQFDEILKNNKYSELIELKLKLPFTKKSSIFRKLFFTPENLIFKKVTENCFILRFSLPSSCYATVLINYFFLNY
ncbi:putative tRNA pseudouridine synthase D [Cucumispora dikerogammari]|nr:putative tRNA pseudouridine synthase D [Cucumispora dikerogammari]